MVRAPLEQEVECCREDDLCVLQRCEVESVHGPVAGPLCKDNHAVSVR